MPSHKRQTLNDEWPRIYVTFHLNIFSRNTKMTPPSSKRLFKKQRVEIRSLKRSTKRDAD